MDEPVIGRIEFGPAQRPPFVTPPVLCSQGGIPYNDVHLRAKDKQIAALTAERALLLAVVRAAKEGHAQAVRWGHKTPVELRGCDLCAALAALHAAHPDLLGKEE